MHYYDFYSQKIIPYSRLMDGLQTGNSLLHSAWNQFKPEVLCMTSQREVVTMSGLLEGMGRSAKCMVVATKISVPGTSEYTYRNLKPFNIPDDLPDGVYTVTYAGRTDTWRMQGRFCLDVCP
jgi:hypothetical protein